MATNVSDLKKNEDELWKLVQSTGVNIGTGWGLGKVLQYVFGSGAGFIGTVFGIFQSFKDVTRKMAEASVRKDYGDDNITVIGQQVASALSSEEIWGFVSKVGGVVWVQDVPITRGDSLSKVVFWHPEHTFKVAKGVTLVYRSVGSQCTIESESSQSTLRPAR